MGVALAACAAGMLASGAEPAWVALVVGLAALSCGLSTLPALRSLTFTAWIVTAVVAAMVTPQVFQPFAPGTAAYKTLLLLLVQAVMFGMGTQMGLRDFAGVIRTPLPVAIGLLCQFTIMPLVGYGLAIAFRLPPEIAAGMVLIGSCSSGLASNVMAYIGRANLALSITLTAVATLLAPIVTPFWMQTLASSLLEGTTIDLSFLKMMAGIVKIVIVPTGAALVHDYLLHAGPRGKAVTWMVAAVGAILSGVLLSGALVVEDADTAFATELAAWILGGVTFGAFYHIAVSLLPRLGDAMPAVAMAGIIYVTGMTTAEGRDNLIAVGVALVVAAALHNLLGYLLGYWMSRGLGLDAQSARTVAFEVGMQNGGMATGLAVEMGKLGTLGLPAAIFIAWMNVSGSLLANYWRRRPLPDSVRTPDPTLA
ncbi:Sodium Bile acid symporter family protein [Botrimarina colliarenosi]|uniref:Sodium Bile acid symporter family protein n=1 Tax=Botrimarina colliarenosi TaxID=2528001 RepID=A0A5C6ACA9_9BACT|nr:Sodium Bile acid symporter family protein [Botrimarina colliarenosi]